MNPSYQRAVVLIPPDMRHWKKYLPDLPSPALFILSNPVVQRKVAEKEKLECEEARAWLPDAELSGVNERARYFATQWCREEGPRDKLTFYQVNLGSLFLIEFTYFFIGVLKACHLAKAVFDKAQSGRHVVLLDNDSAWSRVMRQAAHYLKFKIESLPVKEAESQFKQPLRVPKELLKSSIKSLLALGNSPSPKGLPTGGILYSAAPRYVEPLWSKEAKAMGYYLRPEYSVSVGRALKKKFTGIYALLPFQWTDSFPGRVAALWKEDHQFPDSIDRYFMERDFFNYLGINLWPAIKGEFLKRLSRRFDQYAPSVYGMHRLLDELAPRGLVVDEDVTAFNQALVELANARRIPSVQIQHGIPEPCNHLIPIRTTRLLVPGEGARQRLIGMGAEPESIAVTGAPHFEARLRGIKSGELAQKCFKDLGFSEKDRLVTLISHNFLTEENPDWIGTLDDSRHIKKMIQLACRSLKGLPHVRLAIKLHPRDNHEWFTQEVLREEGALREVRVLKSYDSISLVCASSMILCSLTTVYYEALLLERPVFIFDDSRNRRLEFMSKEFLDLVMPERTAEKIRDLASRPSLRDGRLARQKQEKEEHFLDANRGSVERFWQEVDKTFLKNQPVKVQYV